MSNPAFAVRVIEKLIHRVRAAHREREESRADGCLWPDRAPAAGTRGSSATARLVITERLTQKDIASRVGASREMVSLILKDLTAGGYIRSDGHVIVIERTPPPRW